jgi:drug/metabolite transporter (DMT)-like permease
MADNQKHPSVAIAAIISGVSLVIVVIIAILARNQLSIAAWIVAALAVMGMGLGYFASNPPRS